MGGGGRRKEEEEGSFLLLPLLSGGGGGRAVLHCFGRQHIHIHDIHWHLCCLTCMHCLPFSSPCLYHTIYNILYMPCIYFYTMPNLTSSHISLLSLLYIPLLTGFSSPFSPDPGFSLPIASAVDPGFQVVEGRKAGVEPWVT